MSDPISSSGQIGAAATAVRAATAHGAERSRRAEDREERTDRVDRRDTALVASASQYRVKLDPETLRVITEVINPGNGEVMFYLPPGYRPALDAAGQADRNEPADGGGQ